MSDDSGAPVVFKRSKAKTQRSTRRLETESKEEPAGISPNINDNEGDDNASDSPSTLASKLKKKARIKPKSRLSFGADEEGEGEVFQLKKSNLSRKIKLNNAPPSNLDQATLTLRNGEPTYDAAYLSELKASTPSTLSRPQPTEREDVIMSITEEDDQSSLIAQPNETAIPSASSITAAKQKRGRLRANPENGGDDYISLSLTKRDDTNQGPHPESRLMREDDELGEGDDEFAEYTSAKERIALGKKSRKAEANRRREEMVELIADAEEVDEETAEWEQEQLRRGGHGPDEAQSSVNKPVYKPHPIPPVTQIPTLSTAQARLSSSLTTLTGSHAQNSTALASLAEERMLLDAREQEMRAAVAAAEEKRSWFATFREWMEGIAGFLDEKYPQLEKLEDDYVWLLQERRKKIVSRKKMDNEDDLAMFLGSPATLPVDEEVDDMGRVLPQSNPEVMRRERRTARNLRRAARRHPQPTTSTTEEEGFSTDSELSPSDSTDYDSAIQDLIRRKGEVLADVRARDFRDPRLGLAHWFGQWRTRYPDVYSGAWGGLGMIGAWEFWARLECVDWNPFESGARSLDEFDWYVALYEYSRPQATSGNEEDEDEHQLGPDGDLVSAMVSTAIVPRICKLLQDGAALNPFSSSDLRRLVDLAEQIELSLGQDHAKFQTLIKSTLAVFQSAVTELETTTAPFLAVNQPRFDPEAIPARRRILARHAKLLANLLRWRRYAGDTFGLDQLASRLVERSMLSVAESGWEVGGEERMRKVLEQLPNELVSEALKQRMVRH